MAEKQKQKRTRANGEGTVYRLPNGKWRAEITIGWDIADGAKKRKVKTKSGFKLKRDALDWIKQFDKSSAQDKSIKFNELYELWSVPRYAKVSNDTSNGYKAAYRHAEPLWYRDFASIKAADMQAVVDACTLSRRTKADIKFLFSALYKYAIENDYVDKNYAEFVHLPKKEKGKRDAFTSDEITALWNDYNNGNEFTGYILIMIYTGMRYGELSKTTTEHINLDEKYIQGSGIKTEAGKNRSIPIADCILPIIKKFCDKTDKKILTMHEKVFYNEFRVTLERLKIRSLSPHCCRHTFMSLMTSAGIQPGIIMDTAGHTNYKTTLEYTHIKFDDKAKAVNSMFVPSSSSK